MAIFAGADMQQCPDNVWHLEEFWITAKELKEKCQGRWFLDFQKLRKLLENLKWLN